MTELRDPSPHANLRRPRRGRYVLLAGALLCAGLLTRPAPAQAIEHVTAREPAVRCAVMPPSRSAPAAPRWLSGRLGLWVARVDPATRRTLDAVSAGADQVFPLASSYKQAVLWAALRDVDAGRLDLDAHVTLGSGERSLGDAPAPGSTVRELMTRMIHVSDNTATDYLHRVVGLGAPQALADALNLCHTRLLLPTKTWWTAQAGLDPSFPGAGAFARQGRAQQLATAARLDAASRTRSAGALDVALERYFATRWSEPTDLGTQNVSTPAEFAQLMGEMYFNSGLSARSDTVLRDVMSTGYGRRRLRGTVSAFGGKGGNGHKILTMTGTLRTASGDTIVYVFAQHGSAQDYTMSNLPSAFDWINAAIEDLEARRAGPVAGR